MPKDNIDRAIKRGTGEGKDNEAIERVTYEGYAANGVAVMVDCLTENRNRTVSEVRHVLSHAGGSLAEVGAVSWQFEHICYFSIPAEGIDYDKVFEAAVEGGANDVTNDGEYVEIFGPLDAFKEISNKLEAAGVEPEEAELRFQPKQEMELDAEQSLKVLHVIDMLEDLDDVQNVFSNMALNEEALKAFEAE
jgi:YebC/PmpR family DNA-binding regulatory protein